MTVAAPSAEAAAPLPVPVHPEHYMMWTKAEREAIASYGERCARAALRAVGAGEALPPAITAAIDGVAKDAARGRWLREWLVRRGLLVAQRCTPEKGAELGAYWILRRPAVIDGGMPEGHGKTEEEAIDAARARAAEGGEG